MEVTQKNEIQSRTNVSRSTSCPSKIRPSLITHNILVGVRREWRFARRPRILDAAWFVRGETTFFCPHLSASLPSDNLTAKGQFIIAGQVADVFPLPFSQVASPHSPH